MNLLVVIIKVVLIIAKVFQMKNKNKKTILKMNKNKKK